ncbi:MAG: hypothetical protein WBM46_18080, partial [Polyangiales bacterium]
MGYSSAGEARQARETLGKALEALQQEEDVPGEALGITQNVAQAIAALFEAEQASTEPDGKTCVKNALGTLSQTLALLQDVKSTHVSVQKAIETIAEVVGVLFPLTNKPSVRPNSASERPSARAPASQRPPASPPASQRPSASPPASQRPPASAPSGSSKPASGGPSVVP